MKPAEWLSNNLNRIRHLKINLAHIRQRWDDSKKAWDKQSADFQNQITQLQASCKHEETTHHNGYEDSYTDCDICGKVIR